MNKKKLLACLSVLLAATVAFLAYRSRAQAVTIRSWAPSSVITAGSFIDSVNSGFYLDPAASVTSLVIAGNLGIGATPSAAIGFEGESSRTIQIERRTSANTLGKALIIRAGGAASGATNKAGGDLYLLGGTSTGTGTSNIQFQTASAGVSGTTDNTPTTKMIILGSGSVGVGTDNPSGLFAVGSSNQFQVDNNGNITATGATGLSLTGTSGGGDPSIIFGAVAGGPNKITTSGTTNLAIMPGGNVGIGTTGPIHKLSVAGSGVDTISSVITGSNAAGETSWMNLEHYRGTVGSPTANSAGDTLGILNFVGYTNARVGAARLRVDADTGWGATGSDAPGVIYLMTSPDGSATPVERVTINSTGNVGIGTTGPAHPLDVSSSGDTYIRALGTGARVDYNTPSGRFIMQRIIPNGTGVANNDVSGIFLAYGTDNAGTTGEVGEIRFLTSAVAAGAVTGDIAFLVPNNTTIDNISETMRISGGNIGIGTTGPGAPLHIALTSNTVDPMILEQALSSAGLPAIEFKRTRGTIASKTTVLTGDGLFGFDGYGYDGTNYILGSRILYNVEGTVGTNRVPTNITFSTHPDSTGASAEAMRITSAGNVGIGTTTPVGKLEVSGAVTGKALGIFNETGDQNILVASASGTNRFVITNAGNVGIGTTAPGAKLEAVRSDSLVTAKFVQNGGWAETNFALQTTGYSSLGGLRINGADTNNTIMQTSAIGINTGGSGSALALQAGSGNVGIGTTTPGSKLDVLAGVIAVTRASGDTNSATIRLDQNNATTGGNYILTARNTGEFAVYDADTGGDFLYINTSGNVGVKALASATSNSLCYSTTAISGMYTFSTCSSSERYKKNITDFAHGMDYVEKLRPVSFNWKETGKPGVGLIAEEVAAVDPRLVTYTSDGQVEGVRYGELTTVLINALKESRKEIEDLRARVEALE